MIKVGLTGGIGSGKSTVAKYFQQMGIPVYYADDQAKILMKNDKNIRQKIINKFGKNSYCEEKLNTRFLSKMVFNDPKKLKELERIVHPAVRKDFDSWVKKQKSAYVILENAILKKSKMEKQVDYIIFVQADEQTRIDRVLKRDKTQKQEIKKRILNQENENEIIKKADFLIKNDNNKDLLRKKVEKIHNELKILLTKR